MGCDARGFGHNEQRKNFWRNDKFLGTSCVFVAFFRHLFVDFWFSVDQFIFG